ncbi:hypothetical protein AO364_1073 [Moraxella catarrhalis]|nr:hypothetical protein AO364_1073 [Moraxella catarrhalis]
MATDCLFCSIWFAKFITISRFMPTNYRSASNIKRAASNT